MVIENGAAGGCSAREGNSAVRDQRCRARFEDIFDKRGPRSAPPTPAAPAAPAASVPAAYSDIAVPNALPPPAARAVCADQLDANVETEFEAAPALEVAPSASQRRRERRRDRNSARIVDGVEGRALNKRRLTRTRG